MNIYKPFYLFENSLEIDFESSKIFLNTFPTTYCGGGERIKKEWKNFQMKIPRNYFLN